MTLPIAYFVNHYPAISHSFIRREILALERQGFSVQRIALRGWDGLLADAEDQRERTRTRYVLQYGLAPLLLASLQALLRSPRRFISALALALRMGRHAARPAHKYLGYLAEACRILPWLRDSGALHLHAHFGTNSAAVAMLARTLGGPSYSFTVHGPEEFDQPRSLGLGEKIVRSAFVVAVSSFGRSQLYRWIPHAQWPKVKVVHCGLEADFHRDTQAPPPAQRLICVGRLCEQKGQLLLIEAARQLADRGVLFELVLAGDGEMFDEITALIAHYDLGRQVRITGWISSTQVRAEILAARALVLPSFAEGLPVVLMEAMALRRPVLTTYVAGIPELVRNGKDGWLFPAGDVSALVLAIEDFLSHTPESLQAMGDSARHQALTRHDIDIEVAKLAGLFRDTLADSASGAGAAA